MEKFYQIKNEKRLLLLGRILNNFFQYPESGINFRRSTYFYFKNEYGSSLMEISPFDTAYRIAGKDNLDNGSKSPHKTHQWKLNHLIKKEDFKYRLNEFRQSFLPKLTPNDFIVIHGDYTPSIFVEKIKSFFLLENFFSFDAKKEDSKLLFKSNNLKFFGLLNLSENNILFIKNSDHLSLDTINAILGHYKEYKNLTLVFHYSKKVDFMKFKLGEEPFKYFSF